MTDVEVAFDLWTRWYLSRSGRPVDPLAALQANAEVTQRLVGCRWLAMRRAREAGRTWAEIGDALGIDAAHARDVYVTAVEHLERWCPDLLDGHEREVA